MTELLPCPSPMDIALKLNAKAWKKTGYGTSMFDVDKAAEIIADCTRTPTWQPPEGWVLVPKALTPEMRQAIFNYSTNLPVVSEMNDLWDATLATAPVPAEQVER